MQQVAVNLRYVFVGDAITSSNEYLVISLVMRSISLYFVRWYLVYNFNVCDIILMYDDFIVQYESLLRVVITTRNIVM